MSLISLLVLVVMTSYSRWVMSLRISSVAAAIMVIGVKSSCVMLVKKRSGLPHRSSLFQFAEYVFQSVTLIVV